MLVKTRREPGAFSASLIPGSGLFAVVLFILVSVVITFTTTFLFTVAFVAADQPVFVPAILFVVAIILSIVSSVFTSVVGYQQVLLVDRANAFNNAGACKSGAAGENESTAYQ